MEIPKFVSDHLYHPPSNFTTTDIGEITLSIIFYLSINEYRIEKIKNLSEIDNSIELLINDFHETAKNNALLEDVFFEYIIGKYNNSESDEFIYWMLNKYLKLYFSQPNINFVSNYNIILDFLLENDKAFYRNSYLTENDCSLLFDEDLRNYLSSCKTVYFPSLRTGKDIIQLEKFGLSKDCLIIGNESVYKNYLIAKMNLIINGFINIDITQKSAFDDFPFSYLGKIDFVFSFGFFGKKKDKNTDFLIEKIYKNDKKKIDFLIECPNTEIPILDFVLQLASKKGKAVVTNSNLFFYSQAREYRKFLIENNLIDKVVKVDLKDNPFIDLILLDKNEDRPLLNNIDLFNRKEKAILDNDFLEKIVSPFRLSNHDYHFLWGIYFDTLFIESIEQLKRTENLSMIKDVVSSIKRGSHISPNKQFSRKQDNYVHYVKVGNLSRSTNGNYLDLHRLDFYVEKNKKIIDYSCVLVSLLGTNLNSTCFNYEAQAISIGSDVFAIQLNQNKVRLEYFAYQLKTKLVKIQAETLSQSNIITRIDKDDFLNFQFVLPSLEEQEKQLFEIRNVLAHQANAQKEVDEILNQSKYSDYQLIGSIVHSFKNKIIPLLTDYKVLKKFLSNQKVLDLNKQMRPIFEDDTAEDIDTWQDIIERIGRQLDTLPDIFNDVKILQKQELDTKQENISDFIKSAISNYKNIDYKIKVIPSKKPLFVLLDSEAFRSVLENLIDNAKNHAFESMNNKENCKIEFEIKKVKEKVNGIGGEYAQIIYKDNGKGFPKGYTFESYKLFGNKSIQSDGTGIGGFIISKIVELHEGTINLLSTNSSDEFTTQISILLPLS